jgi:hypothetical protein
MNTNHSANSTGFIARGFNGELPLWKAFWLLFVPMPFVLYLAYAGTLWAWVWLNPWGDILFIVLPFSVISFLLMAAAVFVVWRCSVNVTSRTWRYLALTVVAIYLLLHGVRVGSLWWFLAAHNI